MNNRQFCMARLRQVNTQTEDLLETVGRRERIRLTGSCTAEAGGLAGVRMDRVDRIERTAPETEETA